MSRVIARASPFVLSLIVLLPSTDACSLLCPHGIEIASVHLYEDEETRGDAFPVLKLGVNEYEASPSDDDMWQCSPMARSVPMYFDFGSGALTLASPSATRPIQGLDDSMESPQDAYEVRFQRLTDGVSTARVRGDSVDATFRLPAVPLDFEPLWWHSGMLCLGMCPRILTHRFFFYYPADEGGNDSRLSVCTIHPVACMHTIVPADAVAGGAYSARSIDTTWGRLRVYDALNIIAMPLPCCVCRSHAYLVYNATSLMELPLLNQLDPHAVDTRAATPSVYAVIPADGHAAGDEDDDEADLHIEVHDMIAGTLRRSRTIGTAELRSLLDSAPRQQCPVAAPAASATCALPSTLACEYDLVCCEAGGYCANTTVARCERSQWAVMAIDPRPCPVACTSESDCGRGQSCCNWDGVAGAAAETGVCGDLCLHGAHRPVHCPAAAPAASATCALPSTLACEYDLVCCEAGGYCANTTVARCERSQWAVMAIDPRPCPVACTSESDCGRGQSCCNWDGVAGATAETGVCGDLCLRGRYHPAHCPTSGELISDTCVLQPEQRELLCSCNFRWTLGCTNPTSRELVCLR